MAEEDRISSLPDHLLLEIISRIKIMDKGKGEERLMSTREAIKTTTTISKRWQHLWTRLPTLLFIEKDVTKYRSYSFIDKTLIQCSTDVNLKKFKLKLQKLGLHHKSQVNSWLRYAIMRNVQEIDLRIQGNFMNQLSCDDELFFNNSCLISMKLSHCAFNPTNGAIQWGILAFNPPSAIHWDKLKFLCIDEGELDEDSIGKMLSGSPCLEILELNNCYLVGCIPKSLFGNFGVLERLSCDMETYERFSSYDELFLYNSGPISIKLSRCAFSPPNGAIRWDKLKFLCIKEGKLDEDLIGKIISGSPCLETLELNDCNLVGLIPKSLFGNFGVLEHLSCDLETLDRFSYDDELYLKDSYSMSMKLSCCVFNPPNGAIHLDKLKFLCIDKEELDEDSIGDILSEIPFLETLQLNYCRGFSRIDVSSKSVKNLVLSGYGYRYPEADDYIDTLEINAPYILSLTITGKMYLEEFLLENVSSLVKAHLNYLGSNRFAQYIGRDRDDIEEELLRGLLSSLGHVNEIALGDYNCLDALSDLEDKGFQFREGSDRHGRYPHSYRVFSLNHNR